MEWAYPGTNHGLHLILDFTPSGYNFTSTGWGCIARPTAAARSRTRAQWAWWAWGTSSWSATWPGTQARGRGGIGLWVTQRGRSSAFALGWRMRYRGDSRRHWRNALAGMFVGISPGLFGRCGSRSWRTCAHCSGHITPCAVEDCLQHIFGLPAAVRWQGVCEIQTVEPQPWPLSINLRHEPCDHGWSALVCEVCWKGGECVQEMEHDGKAST